jgi:hypothetical protein
MLKLSIDHSAEEVVMSQPHEPTPGADPAGTEQGGAGRIGGAGDASGRTEPLPGAQPAAESEPTLSAAADQPTVQSGQGQGQPEAASTAAFASEPPPGYVGGPPPPGAPPGRYVFVPAGATVRTRRFGPAFGQFARNRATQLVAAVVVGAVIGGGTVAIVDNATHHNQPTRTFFRPGGGFENGNQPGFRYYLPGG